MRLLVIGGAGYVGSVTSAVLVEAGHEVTVVDDLSTGHRDAVPAGAAFRHADVLDQRQLGDVLRDVTAAGPIEAILHFAARSLVGESVAEPARYFRHNITTTANLLEAMRDNGIGTIVFSSTAACYGEPAVTPITEDMPTVPTNPYGASKLAADQMLTFAAPAYGIAAVSLRYFNVAGAYGPQGERHEVETHLIPRLLDVAAGKAPQASVFGTDYPTPDGTAIRDYIHVRDLAEAHLLALGAAKNGEHLICNLGTGTGFSVYEVLEAVRKATGAPVPAVEKPRRPGDPARLVASAERARTVLGWNPERTELTESVADAWAFYRR
ncbi:UDP-glucose 4-epimerase GalE [Catenulispora pinisilvae]|uniref:UDP-glucose 4-epimerase GalE n=1 Tax=Catenulispora pinisilvae TaxID=2705253 RepID=UPI001890BC54|nr:UDP-glucose 4-epimerase GalE [Catenulispora pinisilvae]